MGCMGYPFSRKPLRRSDARGFFRFLFGSELADLQFGQESVAFRIHVHDGHILEGLFFSRRGDGADRAGHIERAVFLDAIGDGDLIIILI